MAKGSKRSNRSDARPSALTSLRSRPPLPLPRLTENLKRPATGPARTLSGGVARIFVEPPSKGTRARYKTRALVPHQIAFSVPQETLVCLRRGRRREVLHALRKTGKGGQRKPRRSSWRHIKC